MNINEMHSFLVHPGKSEEDEQQPISGAKLPHSGALFRMLRDLFSKAEEECDIEIVFKPDNQGRQLNTARTSLETYVREPNLDTGRDLASKLQAVTPTISGLGLLFLVAGEDAQDHVSALLARFPAEEGVVAYEGGESLTVEFLERVFMKNAKSYKSAFFRAESLAAGFLEGRAIDRQYKGVREVANYWLSGFLESDLRTTAKTGSKRFAEALKESVKKAPNINVKQELVAAATLMQTRDGRSGTARAIVESLGLSNAAAALVEGSFLRPELFDQAFVFDKEEFQKHVVYRMVELDNGAILMALDREFSRVFEAEDIEGSENVRFSTEGEIVDQSLRKAR